MSIVSKVSSMVVRNVWNVSAADVSRGAGSRVARIAVVINIIELRKAVGARSGDWRKHG